jgi:glycosyltransferase involved in cell wall biosynthesis
VSVRAILVCVNYDDILSVTLKANARHFEKVLVVSSPYDTNTAAVVHSTPNAELFTTDAFYRSGAVFNKGAALEEGFDVLGRSGWICVLDADILLPDFMDLRRIQKGFLYSPYRRILRDISQWQDGFEWDHLPRHKEIEWAGYFQLFHADDPAISRRPWYAVDWAHAGGCDSDFQFRWPRRNRVRLPFDVLHIGEDGKNWCGRATHRMDGTLPPDAAARAEQLSKFLAGRGPDGRNYESEKVRS